MAHTELGGTDKGEEEKDFIRILKTFDNNVKKHFIE